jgi:MFS family permease
MAQQAAVGAPPSAPGETGISRPRLTTFHSLQYRDYRLLWLGQMGASSSMWMEQLARPLLILELTDSAFLVGLLAATRMVPMLIVGIWAGVVADRVDKRQILLASQLVTLLMHAATAALIITGTIQPWMVFLTTFVSGSSMAFNQPARQSLIAGLVPRESLANAIALNSAAMNLMRIGGPSIAGLVLTFFDFGDLYIVQAFLYVWVMLWTFQILPAKSQTQGRKTGMFEELGEGFVAVKNDKPTLYILFISLILFVWGFPYQSVFVPLIAVDVLDIGKSGAGLLVSITGAGALIGSLAVASGGDSMGRRGLVMLAQIVIYSLALLLFARAGALWLVIPALLITGAMQTSFMSLNNAFILMRTPPELHGRVMSLFSLDRGLIPLGATLGGFLASTVGPQDGLTIMAVVCLGSTLAVALLVPAVRRIE